VRGDEMISVNHKGNFNNTERFFRGALNRNYMGILDKYARKGVELLKNATPIDSGDTANAWDFQITQNKKGVSVIWTNSNDTEGIPVVILIQYGHSTRNGGYVEGRDFINPALRPIFDQIASDMWEEVRKL
jgi:hypothetical protein